MELIGIANKYKNLVLNLTVIVVAFIFAINIYKTQSQEIVALSSKREVEIKKSNLLEIIIKQEKSFGAYKNLLIRQDSMVIMNTLTSIAKDSGIKITSIKPASERNYSEYMKLPFELNISTSSFHNLGKFISRIESDKYVYLVENLIVRPDNLKESLQVNLIISSVMVKN